MIKIFMSNGRIKKIEECDPTGKEVYRELEPEVDYIILNKVVH